MRSMKHLFTCLIVLFAAVALCTVNASNTVTAQSGQPQSKQSVYDVVIYGDSSGAVTAAIAAKREGRSVILVNPSNFFGGMSASGLGATDFLGKRATFGGIASEFYDAIAAAYGATYIRNFEPHGGRQVFEKMIADADVSVVLNEKLNHAPEKGVKMNRNRIESFTTLSGKTYRGRIFIDATYVGDLIAAADVKLAGECIKLNELEYGFHTTILLI